MPEKITITLKLDTAYRIMETLRREKNMAIDDCSAIKGTENRYADLYAEVAAEKNSIYLEYYKAVTEGTVSGDE